MKHSGICYTSTLKSYDLDNTSFYASSVIKMLVQRKDLLILSTWMNNLWSRSGLHLKGATNASLYQNNHPASRLSSMSASSSARAHKLRSQAMDPAQSNSLLVFEPSPIPHIPYSSTTTPTTPYPLPTTLISYTHLSSYNLPHSHTHSTILRYST